MKKNNLQKETLYKVFYNYIVPLILFFSLIYLTISLFSKEPHKLPYEGWLSLLGLPFLVLFIVGLLVIIKLFIVFLGRSRKEEKDEEKRYRNLKTRVKRMKTELGLNWFTIAILLGSSYMSAIVDNSLLGTLYTITHLLLLIFLVMTVVRLKAWRSIKRFRNKKYKIGVNWLTITSIIVSVSIGTILLSRKYIALQSFGAISYIYGIILAGIFLYRAIKEKNYLIYQIVNIGAYIDLVLVILVFIFGGVYLLVMGKSIIVKIAGAIYIAIGILGGGSF